MTSPGHKIGQILKLIYLRQYLSYSLRHEKIVPNYAKKYFHYAKKVFSLCQKSVFMMMTSSMTSQGGLKIGPLYYFINEIKTFFMITKQRAKISSLNFLCICIMLQLYR